MTIVLEIGSPEDSPRWLNSKVKTCREVAESKIDEETMKVKVNIFWEKKNDRNENET